MGKPDPSDPSKRRCADPEDRPHRIRPTRSAGSRSAIRRQSLPAEQASDLREDQRRGSVAVRRMRGSAMAARSPGMWWDRHSTTARVGRAPGYRAERAQRSERASSKAIILFRTPRRRLISSGQGRLDGHRGSDWPCPPETHDRRGSSRGPPRTDREGPPSSGSIFRSGCEVRNISKQLRVPGFCPLQSTISPFAASCESGCPCLMQQQHCLALLGSQTAAFARRGREVAVPWLGLGRPTRPNRAPAPRSFEIRRSAKNPAIDPVDSASVGRPTTGQGP